MSNRNRTAGHDWERKVINDLKEIGYSEAVSSRQASREADNAGIDICNTGNIAIQGNIKLSYIKGLKIRVIDL